MAAMTMISTRLMREIQMQLWATNRLTFSHNDPSFFLTVWFGTFVMTQCLQLGSFTN